MYQTVPCRRNGFVGAYDDELSITRLMPKSAKTAFNGPLLLACFSSTLLGFTSSIATFLACSSSRPMATLHAISMALGRTSFPPAPGLFFRTS